MMHAVIPEFACDLAPDTHWPRIRFNFSNGRSASVVVRTGNNDVDAMQASLAACPTGMWGRGRTQLGETEATADEVAAFRSEVSQRERPAS